MFATLFQFKNSKTELEFTKHSEFHCKWTAQNPFRNFPGWQHHSEDGMFSIIQMMSFICHIHNYTEYNEQWNVFSAFNPSKWSSGQPTVRRPGSSWGFGALLKGLTSVVDTSCQSRDSNPQPWVTSGFKSNALSIRPRLQSKQKAHWNFQAVCMDSILQPTNVKSWACFAFCTCAKNYAAPSQDQHSHLKRLTAN